ncbi:MAG: flippase-like domain-containing protein [Candidatus Handelsmanbacteria bacterium]|nr:flippase-like domain-containing protein [Candidatus Handelsmanbacteria bacterium]
MKLMRLLLPGLGLLLLGYLVGTMGVGELLRHLGVVKWSFPAVLLVAFLWHLSNSLAWSFAFPPGAFKPPFWTLLRAKLAGDAVSQLTPLANLGGEPLKAYLLRGQAPTSLSLAAVVVNKTTQVLTGLVFSSLSFLMVVFYWDLPHALPRSVELGLAAILVATGLMLGVLYRQQRRLFSSLLGWVQRLGIKTDWIESKMTKAQRIDRHIGHFYHRHKGRLSAVALCHALSWLLGTCETYVILQALGVDIDFGMALLITSLSVSINSLFFFMPSNIGVLEGSQVFLFLTLGLSPAAGLSMGIVKRLRKVFWICLGWVCLSQMSRALARAEAAPAQAGSLPR